MYNTHSWLHRSAGLCAHVSLDLARISIESFSLIVIEHAAKQSQPPEDGLPKAARLQSTAQRSISRMHNSMHSWLAQIS
jgi:hypothetical protein